jgi:hypothetical protein
MFFLFFQGAAMNHIAFRRRAWIVVFLALCVTATHTSAQIPRTLSYQGILSDTLGTPKPDGMYAITFRLYNVSSGGTALWSETKSLQVRRGLFSTILGDQTAFPSSLIFDRQYWLSIQPAGSPELLPRIPLSSVGYSLNSLRSDTAQYARTGPLGGSGRLTLPYADSASSPNAIFFLSNQGTGGGLFGHSRLSPGVFAGSDSASALFGVTAGNAAATSGVVGIAQASSGFVNGVYGIAINSPFGIGSAGWGKRMGVYGVTDTGTGVVGQSNFNIGVSGLTSGAGAGVRGEALGTNGPGTGVYGISSNLIGVRGEVTSGGGAGRGVYGKTASVNGAGVYGEATSTSSVNYGVRGVTSSTTMNAAGVRGEAVASSGQTIGVEGVSTVSPIGTGIVGRGRITGGYFEAIDPAGFAGVFAGKVSVNVLQINGGSDLAEPFEVEIDEVEPGTLLVIDKKNPGSLRVSTVEYDHTVAGIVSGAGDIRAGITLGQNGVIHGNTLVAIAGRVYCKAEALSSPIEPGDLLTTSNIPGHAMKATDMDRSHGAIIGKAMSSLKHGMGLVLVLVNLQ